MNPIFLAVALVLTLCSKLVWAINNDEQVIIFPASASLGSDGLWHAPVRSWIFEPEEDSLSRQLLIDQLKKGLAPEALGDEQGMIFERRIRWFLVDNERGEELVLQLGENRYPLPASAANGHSRREIAFVADENVARTRMTLVGAEESANPSDGVIHLIPEHGFSVVSDIDDTIKISEVTDKRRLLENTFLEPFAAPPGMAEFYQLLAEHRVAFHYVSASPWQLYRELSDFMNGAGFPAGDYYLKSVRFTDSTLLDLFEKAEEYKRPIIETLFRRYPHRCFILIGDNGEADPRIYADLARDWSEQVARIYIRRVAGGDEELERHFRGIPRAKWRAFDDHEISELAAQASRWLDGSEAGGSSGDRSCAELPPPGFGGPREEVR